MRASKDVSIPTGHQAFVDTGVDIRIPPGLYGEVYSLWNRSCHEPVGVHGIILPDYSDIKVLVANLQPKAISIRKHQAVGFYHLIPVKEVHSIHDFGTIKEFGLPSAIRERPFIHSVILRKQLAGLTLSQQDQDIALFDKYRYKFAEDDCNLGCAE